jgi:hypothetical protein
MNFGPLDDVSRRTWIIVAVIFAVVAIVAAIWLLQ